jgi:hypothetical protein
MLTYIKTAFTKPKEIYIGRNMKNRYFFSLLLLLSLTLTFLSIFEFIPIARNIGNDVNEIRDSIPEFELIDNNLESATESYIYQTDSMIFYFDPDDNISTDTIDSNADTTSAPVSLGILDDQLYLNLMSQSYSLEYADLNNFTTADLQGLINSFGNVSNSYIVFFIVFLFIFNLILFITQFFPIALFANIISIYRQTTLRFFQSAKMALLAIMSPTVIVYAINAFLFPVRFQFEIILVASLVLYYMSISEMKKRIIEQSKTNNDEGES